MNTLIQLVLSGILVGSVYALMSIGLTLIFGVLRIVNFAHGEFLMIAMYGAWAFTHLFGLNPYIAAVAIVPAMFLFGAVVYWLVINPALDKPHLVVVFATMALSIFLQNAALMAMTADLRDIPPIFNRSIVIGSVHLKVELLLGFAITLLCTFALQWMIRRTYLGKAIRATVQDGEAAMLMGIPVPRIFLITFAGGSALVGLAACVMVPLFSVFPSVGLNFVLIAFVIVVLGGMGSIEGALIGGICVGVVQSLSSYYVAPAFGQMFFFILFLLVMIFRPNGLLGQQGAATIGMNEWPMSVETIPSLSPRRMAWFPTRGRISWFEIALLLIACALVASGIASSLQDVLLLSFLFGGLALAWNIAGGYAGLISFGHSAFFGVGAYASTILSVRYGITPWIGIWIGALIAAMFGAVLALICARLRGPFFILSTLAFAEVVRIGALNWSSLTGGAEGLSIMPTPSLIGMVFASKATYAALMLFYLVAVYAITKGLEASRFGYYLFAIRDNEDAAGAAGVNPLLGRTAALALSAALTGIGGSLFAQYFLYLDPTYVISPELSFQFALLPAVGGLGTAIGPVLGSFLITPLSELLRSYLGSSAVGLHLVIYSFGLIVVMLYFPAGLAGALDKLTRRGRSK